MTLNDKEDVEEFHAAVDILKVKSDGLPSDEWYCVEYFKTKEEAITYAKEHSSEQMMRVEYV